MPPRKGTGQVSASARATAMAQAHKSGKPQPVRDDAGNVAYYLDPQGNQVTGPLIPKGKSSSSGGGKAGVGKLDPESLGSAIQQAKVTGKVQPVRDQAGNILYYVDQGGNAGTDPKAKSTATAQDAQSGTTQNWVDGHGGGPGGTPDPATSDWGRGASSGGSFLSPQQQAAADGQNDPRSRYMMVGGVVQDPVANPDPLGLAGYKKDAKTGALTDGDGQAVDAGSFGALAYNQNKLANSTFSALALPSASYNPNETFLFSQGPNGYQPMAVDPTTLGNRMDDRAQAINASRGQGALTGQKSASNYMTIAQASQWLANLSVSDKDVYNEMVVALNKGGYFASQTGNMNYLPTNTLPLNTYSRNTGIAFVEAAKDLAVAQQAGYGGDFKQWLVDRGKGYEDYVKSGAGYNPVNRQFQDPATLAASAKSAAQQAIGRNLTAAEEAKFEAAFHGKENTAYNEMDSYGRAKALNNLTGKSGLPAGTPTGYTMPDTAGESDQYVNTDPQFAAEKQGYQSLELTKGLIQFLKGGAL